MVKTKYELFDILYTTAKNYQISATDKDGNAQTIISSAGSIDYMVNRYGDRKVVFLSSVNPVVSAEADIKLYGMFASFIANRQHGIDRMFQALNDYDYSPIENVDRYENETTTLDGETKYGKTVTTSETGSTTYGRTNTESGSDSIAYGKTLTDSGSDTIRYGKVDTIAESETISKDVTDALAMTGTETHTISKAGFNTPNTFTNDSKDQLSYNGRSDTHTIDDDTTTSGQKTDTLSGSDATQYGKTETASGTDQTTYGKTDTLSGTDRTTGNGTVTDSGKDERDDTTERELRVHGNIGVTTNTQLIESELDLRKISLAEMLLDDFIAQYTYYA